MFKFESSTHISTVYFWWLCLDLSHNGMDPQCMFGGHDLSYLPLGTLPQFPVTLGGKTVFIDVMVVQDPLNFSLLLGWDYVYAMKAIMSTLFRVISFPHDGRVVTIDQL
jgi:hypothetical protein